jgi:hypothetical protein
MSPFARADWPGDRRANSVSVMSTIPANSRFEAQAELR